MWKFFFFSKPLLGKGLQVHSSEEGGRSLSGRKNVPPSDVRIMCVVMGYRAHKIIYLSKVSLITAPLLKQGGRV